MGLFDNLFGRKRQEEQKAKDSIRCPYCLGEIKPNEILFMVENGQASVDEEYFEFASRFQGYDEAAANQTHAGTVIEQGEEGWEMEIIRGNDGVFPEMLRWRRNGSEWRNTLKRLCPHCHCYLPMDIEKMETKTIVLLGGTSCGKTTLIAGMLFMLVGDLNADTPDPLISRQLGTVRVEGDSLSFAKRMMRNSLVNAERDPTEIAKPIFPIVLIAQNHVGAQRTLVTIHDFAGEGLTHADYFINHPISNEKCKTDGILYAIDCCQLPALQSRYVAHAFTGDITAPLMGFSDMMKRTLSKASAVAVTLTKFDLFMHFTSPADRARVYEPLMPSHDTGVDVNAIKDVSLSVKRILDPNGSQVVQQQMNSIFGRTLHGTNKLESIEYFATACLKPDDNDGMQATNEVTASFDKTCLHRVCEPLLYMFAKWGIFTTKDDGQ